MKQSSILISTLLAAAAMSASAYAVTVSSGSQEYPNGLTEDSLAITSGASVTISGGTSTFSAAVTISGLDNNIDSVLVSGSNSVLNITGNSTIINLGEKSIGTHGGGVINQSGGTVNALSLRVHDTGAAAGTSAYNLSSGVLNLSSTNVANGTSAGVLIGHWGSGAGALNVTGGVLNAANTVAVVSWTSPGVMNISGGEVNLKGINLTGQIAASAATVTLSENGRLNIGSEGLKTGNTGNGNKTYNLNGGTLGALDSWSSTGATLNIGGAVNVDTTTRTVSASGASSASSAGATITLGDIAFANAGSLMVSGAGTLTLDGVITGVAVDSTAKITVSSGTLAFGSGLVFALTGDGDSINGQTLNIATLSGGAVSGTLSAGNFTWNGAALSERTQVALNNGTATFTGGAYNLVWKSGTETWNADTVFDKDSAGSGTTATFVTADNVTFGSGVNDTVTFSGDLIAGKVLIEGSVTLSASSSGTLTAQDGVVVADGGTLAVGVGGQAGLIRGSLTVQSGGTARFDIKDVCGWGPGTTLEALTVDSGGSLVLNHGSNETFRGTLTLNGTMSRGTSGGTGTAWDLYGGSAKIVTTEAGAKIEEGVKLRLRQNNSEIQVGPDATLEIASTVCDETGVKEGNGLLRKTGTGTLILSGANTYVGGTNIEAGTVVAKTASALGTGAVSIAANSELQIDIGAGTEMRQGSGTISSTSQNESAKLTVASGKLVLTSDSNNFRGTVDILSGGVLELGSTAKLLTEYSNTSKIYIRTGGELRLDNFAYNQLGASPDYAVHRQIDGGRLTITGATSESGQGFTVTANGGEFLMEQSGQTLTLNGNANSEIIALGGALKIGGAGDIVINKHESRIAIAGAGSLEKVGAGTLTINSAGNTYAGGTVVSAGTLVAGAADALGTGDVKVENGAHLEVAADVTLNSATITVVLNDEYLSVAALGGSGVLADGTKIVITAADETLAAQVASFTLDAEEGVSSYKILGGNLASSSASNVTFEISGALQAQGWKAVVSDGSGNLVLSVPEPSAFGLLAGLGALALVASRRRRRR